MEVTRTTLDRIRTLESLEILDTDPEPEFDDLTWIVSHALDVPMSTISLLDDKRQWFKSVLGITSRETPIEIAFCAHTIREPDRVLVVPDAKLDPRFVDSPLVTGYPNIRFYAGAPLVMSDGVAIGALCAIDTVPRSLPESQIEMLRRLARQVICQLELRRETICKTRQAAEESRSSALLRAILESASVGIISTDPEGRIVTFNRTAEQQLGWKAPEMIGTTNLELLHDPLDLAKYAAEMSEAVGEEVTPGFKVIAHWARDSRFRERECSIVRKDGSRFDCLLSMAQIVDDAGEFAGFVGIGVDITVRKKTEALLRESEAKNQAILDTAVDAIITIDEQGLVELFNRAAESMFGYDATDVIGRNIGILMADRKTAQVHTYYLASHLAGNEPTAGVGREVQCRRRDGTQFTAELAVSEMRLGKQVRYTGFLRDISDRLEAQRALERELGVRAEYASLQQHVRQMAEDALSVRERQIHAILERLPLVIFTCEANGIITFVQGPKVPPFSGALGFIGRNLADVHGFDIHLDAIAKALSGTTASITLRFGDRVIQAHLDAVKGANKAVTGLVGICFDVSEQVGLERQLSLAQKLESVGRLAAGIAHEINSPLQYIGDNIGFSIEATTALFASEGGSSITDESDFYRQELPIALAQAKTGVESVASLVRSLKDYAHPGSGAPAPTDINHCVKSTVTISKPEWRYVADVELDLDPAMPQILSYPGEFNQAILNLIVNAVHAIEVQLESGHKGHIRIRTRWAESGRPPANKNWRRSAVRGRSHKYSFSDPQWENGYVQVSILDDGCGIPKRNAEFVFEPFFTTKPFGKGTGQGLTLARAIIVEKMHGTIEFESQVGVGTEFVINLPATPSLNLEISKAA